MGNLRHYSYWAASSAAILAGIASAQAQTPAKPAQAEPVEEVVVTGSRIQTPGMTSPTPLTAFSESQFKQTAPTSVDEILSQMPSFRQTAGPNQASRNSGSVSTGQSLADLRGLGTQRTLVLIDGTRPVPTNASGTTSTSIIPLGLIKRVDVLTGGASAAYGSDAVAGITNFILKDRLDEFRGSVYGGVSQQGDNQEYGFSLADGASLLNDRLHVVFGADYNKNKGVGNIYSREWSAIEPGNSGNPISFGAARPAGTPALGWASGVEYAAQTPGGVITAGRSATGVANTALNLLAFNPDGSTTKLIRGPVFGNLMINSSSNPTATPIAQWQLKEPLSQFAGLTRATYDITDTTSAYVMVNYAQSHVFAVSQFHQTPVDTILATNPYLPASMKALMAANNIAQIDLGRVDTEWLGTTGDNDSSTIQVSTGIKGKVFTKFNWDLSYNFGRSFLDSRVYGTREANLAAATYAVTDSSGNIVCGPLATNPNFATAKLTNTIQVANVQPGCVPLNPFGVGNSSAAARAYVAGLEYTTDTMLRHDFAANLNGSLFSLPAGPVSFAAGGEYRFDSLKQVADPLQIQGVYSSGNNKTFSGHTNVTEGYLEVEAPLLSDMTAIKALGVNAAVRHTDYKISGAVTTWKVGGTYEHFDGLLFRGTRSQDIRAPSLSDLFLIGGISATGSFTNPFNGQSARLPVQTVGNPSLTPEQAETSTVGFAYNFKNGFLSGAHLAVDYYRIKVSNVIASVAATDILARCYQGVSTYCSAIQFDKSTFGIAKILTQPFNQALLDEQGVDIEAGYHSSLERLGLPGAFDLSVFASNLQSLKQTDRPGPSGVTVNNAGFQNGAPRWVVSTYLNYQLDPYTVGLEMKAFTSIGYNPINVGPGQTGYDPSLSNSINQNVFPGLVYFNLNGTYEVPTIGHPQVFANVNNLFDRHPPLFAIAAINLGGNPYDYVGRTFKFGVRFGF